MKASKEYMKTNQIVPYISFKDGGAHTVTLIKDKVDSIKDGNTGGTVEGVKFLVEENGEKKSFFTSSVGLIQKLSEFDEGAIVTIKMVSKKVNGEFRSSFLVKKGDGSESSEEDDDEEEDGDATPQQETGW